MSDLLMLVVFVVGMILVAAGAWLVSPSAGLIVAGGEMVALVIAYSRPSK
jgi:uncharacterized membrane protein